MSNNQQNLSDNIWFTMKARIQASNRLLSADSHSQFLLVFYSLVNVCLSIILISDSNLLGQYANLVLVIMSVIILVFSLYITSRDLKGRSEALKKHYVDLQDLYRQSREHENIDPQTEDATIRKKYFESLKSVENHKTIDDIVFRASNSETTRKITFWEKANFICFRFIQFFKLLVLYSLPFAAIYLSTIQ